MSILAQRNGEREFPLSRDDFRFIADLTAERTGIVLGDHKVELVYSRLSRRLRQLGLSDFSEYVKRLRSDQSGEETTILVNAITTNLTRFFRSPEHFDHLQSTVLPDSLARIKSGKASRIRIWSAGCSTGEEPYSIAISILQKLASQTRDLDVRILATDIDTNMLDVAASGIYADDSLVEMSPQIRQRFFDADKGGEVLRWRVKREVRDLVTFKKLNLLSDWPMRRAFDAIMCRNVMIYFDPHTKEGLVNRFADILRPRGWLYLGSSESLTSAPPTLAREGSTIYRSNP